MTLVLAAVAAILAGITLVQSRGTALVAWAVLLLALIFLLPKIL